jgi:hypothetical protein
MEDIQDKEISGVIPEVFGRVPEIAGASGVAGLAPDDLENITFRGCFGDVAQAADEVPRPRRIFPSTDTVASLSAARFRRTSIRHASPVGRPP